MSKSKDSGEFASDWHRDAYVESLHREIARSKQTIDAVKDNPEYAKTVTDLEDAITKASAELKRLKAAA